MVGDCTAVEYRSDRTAVRYASDYFCAPRSGLRVPEDQSDPCIDAKRQLLEATDPEEIEVLERKVTIICDAG